jgi:hypothetical protein
MNESRLNELQTEFQIYGKANLDNTDLSDIFYIIESQKTFGDLLTPIEDFTDEITATCDKLNDSIESIDDQIEKTIRLAQINDLPDHFQVAFINSLELIQKQISEINKDINGRKNISITKTCDKIQESVYMLQHTI